MAVWPRHGESIREYPTSVSGHWWNQNQNGHALDVLVNLRVLEDMRTTTIGQASAGGHPRDTVGAPAKASTRVKRADRQQPRRWMESLAPS